MRRKESDRIGGEGWINERGHGSPRIVHEAIIFAR